ncbi:non-ribosomal peptide synthetase [Streptomyces xiaopingdaonensis]|uniref:non-ribosomal peptide synthetase n=1 Tax=Streptomyces xiaopingdaonensis TaxID=1565415 RepID=UPI00192C32EC|nr:non-ribosomal peptide synthetase [Streptomyces xiaopingdaonensis]
MPARRMLLRHTADGAGPLPLGPGDEYELVVDLKERGNAVELSAEYDGLRYPEADVLRFLGEMQAVLSALANAEKDSPVDDMQSVVGAERAELLALGRGSALPAAPLEPVHVAVHRQAAENPGAVAVVSGGDRLDYAGLDGWAEALSKQLQALGVGPGDRVGVLAEPSVAMIAGVLGVLDAGAAYVPVDPSQPDDRVTAVFSDAQVSAVLTTATLRDRASGLGLPAVDLDGTAGETATPTPVSCGANDAAYLIYTSGTTGEPKGVVVEHAQLAASTSARRSVYPGRPVFLLVSPLAFDSSAAGIWGTLTAGGRIVVAQQDEVRDTERLVKLVEEHRVTHLLCVPSLHSVLLDAAESLGAHRLRCLDTVVVAGEPLTGNLLERHFGLLGETASLVNEYGPTETTVWASYRLFEQAASPDIGGPVPGAALYVLDDDRRLLPRGVTGELAVGGAGVARGYFGRPDATERAFVRDPFAGDTHARMYLTGDLVRWSAEGTLQFLGRRDHQVKIRGHRIEIGAVEAALHGLPAVRDAAVVLDDSRTSLVGFVSARHSTTQEDMRTELARTLSAATIPARIHLLDRLPRTANGKVDRAALSAMARDAAAPAARRQPPGDRTAAADLTARVATAWGEVLGISEVPSTVNFFDLGGHSLMMFRLQDALEAQTGVRPSPVDLFRHTTVAAQAALVREGGDGAGSAAPEPRSRDRRALALQARRRRASRTDDASDGASPVGKAPR